MKTAKLKNGLICVSVPMDATNFRKFVGKNDEQYQILGTITANECSFDLIDDLGFTITFDSFKSMIEAETEFLFDNPLGKQASINFHTNENNIKQWQSAQSRVIEKILILKTI